MAELIGGPGPAPMRAILRTTPEMQVAGLPAEAKAGQHPPKGILLIAD